MASKHFKISDDEASQRVDKLVTLEGRSSHRYPFEKTALRNRLYFLGKHWFIEDNASGFFREPRIVGSNRVLYKANLLLGNVLRSMLTIAGAAGDFTVPPAKNTRDAKKASWTATKLFEHLSYTVGMRELDQLACLMAALDGSVIWKVYWDPDIGEPVRFYYPDYAEGKAVAALSEPEMRELESEGKYRDERRGDVRVELKSIFEMWWDWKARDRGFRDAEWACEVSLVSRDWARDVYGKKVDDIPASDGKEGSLYYNELISFMSGQFGASADMQKVAPEESDEKILMRVLWEVPRPSNGMMGRYIVKAENTVLENRDNPNRATDFALPFVRQNWITCPGRFWGISLAENMTSAQHQYNVARSKKIQHQNVYGQPMTFIPESWNVPEDVVSLEPGAIRRYNAAGGGDMKQGPVPMLPKEVNENAAEARAEMAEISSQQSIDNSKLPGQIRSASGLEAFMDERNKMLIHPAENFLLSKEQVGQHMLALAHKNYPDDRIVHYVGEDRKWRALHLRRVDIKTDLRVMIDRSKMLQSPGTVKARTMEMLQLGALNPADPDEREAILKAMEFQIADELVGDRLVEEENQEREIEEMLADPTAWIQPRADMMAPQESWQVDEMTGQPKPPIVQGYPINPFDDHRIHAKGCVRFMRSEEFRELDPISQSLVMMHHQAHEAKVQEEMMQELMMQQAMQGAPGQPGAPSKAKQPTPAL